MNRVLEIETALKQLPPEERWEIARWLLDGLQEVALGQTPGDRLSEKCDTNPPLPDYSARRRRIFGDKILPNMVLLARSEERF